MATRSDYRGRDFDEVEVFRLHNLLFGYRGLPFPAGSLTQEIPTLLSPLKALRSGASILKSIVNKNGFAVKVFMPIELGGLYLPNTTMSVRRKKRIVSTELTNRDGEVNELINLKNFVFRIQGVVVDDAWPEDFIADLNDLDNRNESVEIKNGLTDILLPDERQVIIEGITLPAMKGHPNTVAYEINLMSDKNFVMTITENVILSGI